MGRYFDYQDWRIEDIANSIRERLEEARTPLPPKVKKHRIIIRHKVGDGCYVIEPGESWMYEHDEFTSRNEAIDYLNSLHWLEKVGDNAWVDIYSTFGDKANLYEINEYDSEVYADEQYHIDYSQEEIKYLSDALKCIEKARVYMKEYDSAENNCSFGKDGSFKNNLEKSLEKFENEYTESLPEDYHKDEDY